MEILIPSSIEARLLVSLILSLWIVGLVMLWRERLTLLRENTRLREWSFLVQESERPEIIDAIQQTYSRATPDLVTSGLQSICKARDVKPDLEAICSMLSQSEARRLAWPTIMPNLLMLLGLLGTVLGLARAIAPLSGQIMGAATNADPRVLADGLQATLGSMSVAFTVTIWGIFAAFTTGTYLRFVANLQDRLLEDVQEFIIAEVGPKILPQPQETAIQDLTDAVKQVGTITRRVPKLMEQAAVTFKETLDEASADMKSNLGILQGAAADIQQQMIQSGIEMKASSDSLTSATNAIANASDDLKHYHADLGNSHQQILESNERAQREIAAQVADQITNIRDLRTEVMRTAGEIVDRISTASDRYETCSLDFRKSADAAGRTVDEYRDAVAHRFEQLQVSVHELFSQHQAAAEHVSAEIRDLAGRLAPATLDREWAEMKQLLSQLDSTFRNLSLTTTSDGSRDLLAAISKLEEAVSGHAATMGSASSLPVTQTGSVDGTLRLDLRDAITAMNRLADAVLVSSRSQSSSSATRQSGESASKRASTRKGWIVRAFRKVVFWM